MTLQERFDFVRLPASEQARRLDARDPQAITFLSPLIPPATTIWCCGQLTYVNGRANELRCAKCRQPRVVIAARLA